MGDASCVFWNFHGPETLAKWKPAATYNELELNDALADPAEVEFRALTKQMRADGWYETPYLWLVRKIAVVLALILSVVYLINTESFWCHAVAAVAMAAFWQQSGFLMHDFMHNSVFQKRDWDQAFGMFFGTICFGVSTLWWRDEHFEHHLFTNTYVEGVGPSDPQEKEDVWMQNHHLRDFSPWNTWFFRTVLVRIQHIIYIPLNVLAGRYAIIIDSLMEERRPKQLACIALNWAWTIALLFAFPGKSLAYALTWLYCAGCLQGVLHLQLLVSHYDKPFTEKQQTKCHSYLRRQAAAIVDIKNPRWMDWFHGGLNFHLVHHVWPKLPRARYREANDLLLELCAKHGIHVDRKYFFESHWDVVKHLKKCSDEYRMELAIGDF